MKYFSVVKPVLLLLGCALQIDAIAQDAPDAAALNVSIVVFDAGVPADRSLHRDLQVFPRIREIEAMFLPFVLRETLAATSGWGAVRVVPEPDVAAELLVSGAILKSDGESLELKIRAIDASGRVWLDKLYTGVVDDESASLSGDVGVPGQQRLYDEIAQDLELARAKLTPKTLADIANISLLRYANQLAPMAFGDYLDQAADGTFSVRRLPARSDPMLERIGRIRSTEFVFTDTVDEKFRSLHAEIASTYDLWREYRRKTVAYQEENAKWAEETEPDAPRGSYESIKSRYDNYKWDRITVQEQDSMAVAFDNEVRPTIEAMETRVAELNGWVADKYLEWNRLLEELFDVETRLER